MTYYIWTTNGRIIPCPDVTVGRRLPRKVVSRDIYWRGFAAGAYEAHSIWCTPGKP